MRPITATCQVYCPVCLQGRPVPWALRDAQAWDSCCSAEHCLIHARQLRSAREIVVVKNLGREGLLYLTDEGKAHALAARRG